MHTLKDYGLLLYDKAASEKLGKARFKSRYVAQGFGEVADNVYAATPSTAAVRVVLTLAALYGWDVQTADVSTAFLHAPVDGLVYVRAPKHLRPSHPGQVWRLEKALYGLKTAPRCWQQHAANILEALG